MHRNYTRFGFSHQVEQRYSSCPISDEPNRLGSRVCLCAAIVYAHRVCHWFIRIFMICLFVITVSTTKSKEQLLVQKLDRSLCERLLTVNGKPEQYVLRESTKVQQFDFHTRFHSSRILQYIVGKSVIILARV